MLTGLTPTAVLQKLTFLIGSNILTPVLKPTRFCPEGDIRPLCDLSQMPPQAPPSHSTSSFVSMILLFKQQPVMPHSIKSSKEFSPHLEFFFHCLEAPRWPVPCLSLSSSLSVYLNSVNRTFCSFNVPSWLPPQGLGTSGSISMNITFMLTIQRR